MANTISEITRRAIIDELQVSGIDWSGRLPEPDFLARLYDLTALPSTDSRHRNAAGDIFQHRVNWQDWPADWVFYDDRFNLLHAPDDQFLLFLSETVSPVVRPDIAEALGLVGRYNNNLRHDGWELVEYKQISGRPLFRGQQIAGEVRAFPDPIGWPKVDRQVEETRTRLAAAVNEEQFQAVGLLCREVLITVGQTVFDATRHPVPDGITPSDTDAKRRLESFFDAELAGSANDEARGHAKAAVKLALALQHKRTADWRTAALCAEATISVANLAAIVGGQRRRAF